MIVVVAPYPAPDAARDGWRSRIAAVDRLLADQPRVYVEVVDEGLREVPAPQAVGERVQLQRLDLSRTSHARRLRELLSDADLVYVHTVHSARYVLPFYATGKVVTDVHGLAPEEEEMYGKSASRRFYDEVEAVVLRESRFTVAVTEAMVEHLRRKHPQGGTEFVVLPVLSLARPRPDVEMGPRSPPERPRVIYSGALQRWQNPELMFDLLRDTAERYEFTVLTPDVQAAHE